MLYISPLYNLIDTFCANTLNAYAIKSKKTLDRSYFLVELDTKDVQIIIPEPYTLKDAHFSIDEMYSKEYGYTPIHYTQRYSAPGKEDIVIHGYLDIEGNYKYCHTTSGKLTKEQEEALKKEIKKALPALNPIFKEQKRHQTQLKRKVDYLDDELTNLSKEFKSKKNNSEYIRKACQFLEATKEYDYFSVIPDPRSSIIFKRIKTLEAIQECLSSPLETKQADVEEPDSKVPCLSTETLSKEEKLKQLYQEIFTNLNSYIENFQKSNQTNNQLVQWMKAINEQLFFIYSFPESMLSKADKQKINRILTKTQSFQQKQYSQLKTSISEINLDSFKEKFSLCENCIDDELYILLLNKLIEEKNPEKEPILITMVNFLNQNDPNYKKFIYKASQDQKYPVSKKALKRFFPGNPNGQKEYEKSSLSLLFKLYTENKFNAFSTLLEHGANPNSWSMNVGKERENIALFYLIANTPNPGYLEYLKILLHHNADPHATHTKEKILEKMKELSKFDLKKMRSQLSPREKNYDIISLGQAMGQNIVALLSDVSGIEGLTMILPHANLESLCQYLSTLINDKRIMKRLSLDDHYALYYVNDINEADAFSKTIDYPSFLSRIIYPNPKNSKEDDDIVQIIYQKIALIELAINEKIKQSTLEEFKTSYKNAFQQAMVQSGEGKDIKSLQTVDFNPITGYNYFLGCEILLLKYTNETIACRHKQRLFIQKYSNQLYTNLLGVLSKIPNSILEMLQQQNLKAFYAKPFRADEPVDRAKPILTKITVVLPNISCPPEENKKNSPKI